MAKGKVVQVIGTVVDMEFPKGELPAIYNGIIIPMNGSKLSWRHKLILVTIGYGVSL